MVAKGQILRRENKSAAHLKEHQKNPLFGFSCLHYSVSEGAGALKIKILNKSERQGIVQVRTVDGEALAEDDYKPINEEVKFKSGQTYAEVAVKIIDDDQWEPDEDFYVELCDGPGVDAKRLVGEDTRTRVTILDDDAPGMLVFDEKKAIRHPANEDECYVFVNRISGSDGVISCEYKTVPLGKGEQQA